MSDNNCRCNGASSVATDETTQQNQETSRQTQQMSQKTQQTTEETQQMAEQQSDRWLDERPVGTAQLPAAMGQTMSRFYTTGPVETLDDFVAATRAEADGGPIELTDLCHTDSDTPHVATTLSDTYQFQCFYDGVALAALTEERVEIQTASPAGTEIELQVTAAGDIDTTPENAVMSFGIDADAPEHEGSGPTVEQVYGTICPYVKAFPSRERYEQWAERVDAYTVGLPAIAGFPIARALVEKHEQD